MADSKIQGPNLASLVTLALALKMKCCSVCIDHAHCDIAGLSVRLCTDPSRHPGHTRHDFLPPVETAEEPAVGASGASFFLCRWPHASLHHHPLTTSMYSPVSVISCPLSKRVRNRPLGQAGQAFPCVGGHTLRSIIIHSPRPCTVLSL
jgi:hypothetical protein